MNLLQRAYLWADAKFSQMLFPGYGGQSGWTYSSTLILPAIPDYDPDASTSSAVMACVLWLARTFPEAPVQVARRKSDGTRDVLTEHGMVALLEEPNEFYSGVLLWMATLADWILSGNAYWFKIRNGAGAPIQLWWAPSGLVQPRWDTGEYIGWYEYLVDGRRYRIERVDVVHFRYGIDPHNTRLGLSPLASVLREIFTDEEAAGYSAALLKNMGVPGVIISPKATEMGAVLDETDADVIKAQFKKSVGGVNRGEPIVLDTGVDLSIMSFNPQQMDLKVLRRLPEERVTAVLGIPAIVAGLGAGLDRSTFANYAEAREAAYESNIIPTQRLFAADLKSQLLGDFGETRALAIQFDTSGVRVLQEDQNNKALRWGQLVKDGIAMLSESRSAMGLPVGSEHEVFLRPFNIVETVAGGNDDEPDTAVANATATDSAPVNIEATAGLNGAQISAALAILAGVSAGTTAPTVAVELLVALGLSPEKATVMVSATPLVTVEAPAPLQLTDTEKARRAFIETKAYGRAVTAIERRATNATRDYLNEQYERAASGIEGKKARQLPLDFGDEIRALWTRFYPLIIAQSWHDAAAEIGVELAFDLENRWVQEILEELAEKVVEVADFTKEEIRRLVGNQAEEGWSIEELAGKIRELKDVHSRKRAIRIARTETGTAYNLGTLTGYQEAGIKKVEVFDGDDDEPCASANGSIWTVEQARKEPLGHPNCVRAFGAIVE